MGWLDQALYRHPFEGASARRYERAERPAFGDLDDRVLDGLDGELSRARTLLDVGCGPQTFAERAVARYPHVRVIAADPSRDFARARGRTSVLRAAAEALPIATGVIDVAVCLSSIRHVRDRGRALAELRRVVRPGGVLVIVELDPDADRGRIAAHARRLRGPVLRLAFGPLVLRTAPSADDIAALTRAAGWRLRARRDDREQPVYVMELT